MSGRTLRESIRAAVLAHLDELECETRVTWPKCLPGWYDPSTEQEWSIATVRRVMPDELKKIRAILERAWEEEK